MQLLQKQKIFSAIFFPFLKSILNLDHFWKKDDFDRWCVSDITDSKKRGEIMV